MAEINPINWDAYQEDIEELRHHLENLQAQCARGEPPELSLEELHAMMAQIQRVEQLLIEAARKASTQALNLDNDTPPA